MRVIFLGTPDFAVPSLRVLLGSSYRVSAVFTQPDRPAGRGQKAQPPPVKILALGAGIPVYQPEKIRSEEVRPLFESLVPDFVVVVAYGQILPGWLLKAARVSPINIHASLLPRYRGAAPVAWAILRGETVSGVTTMLMDEQLDTGPILLARQVPIQETATGGEMAAVLAQVGADMLLPTLDGLRDGTIQPVPQDHNLATWAPRISKGQGQVSWSNSAMDIHNLIRAFNPWPLAFSVFRGQRLQLLRSMPAGKLDRMTGEPGTYLRNTQSGILVQCGHGTILEVLEVKPESRGPISGREFANGARLQADTQLFCCNTPD